MRISNLLAFFLILATTVSTKLVDNLLAANGTINSSAAWNRINTDFILTLASNIENAVLNKTDVGISNVATPDSTNLQHSSNYSLATDTQIQSAVVLTANRSNSVNYYRSGNSIYGITDKYTGEQILLNKAFTLDDGAPITEDDVDNVIYFKVENEYFRRDFDIINIKSFGVKGDGSDESAILNTVFNKGYPSYFIPKGLYRSTGITIINQSNFNITAEEGAVFKNIDGNSGESLVFSKCSNFKLTGLQLIGTGQYGVGLLSKGILISNSQNFTIENCKVSNCSLRGIEANFSSNGTINKNKIDSCQHGIRWWGGDAAKDTSYGVKNITIKDNNVKNVNGGGIWGSCGYDVNVMNNIVENSGDVGIDYEHTSKGNIRNNRIKNAANGGISFFFNSSNIVASGNTILKTNSRGLKYGIWFTGKPAGGLKHQNITLTKNLINGETVHGFIGVYADLGVLRYAKINSNVIKVNNAAVMRFIDAEKVDIIANKCYKVSGSDGIRIEGASGCKIINNTIETGLDNARSVSDATGGIILFERNARFKAQKNTLSNNRVKGFYVSIYDQCWISHESFNKILNNKVDGLIYRNSGSAGKYKGVVKGNRSILNPLKKIKIAPAPQR
ncbi:MAG: Moonbeam29 [Segetibacter sp.]|nr:Moonbeam29 [Segetibacter sp.]